MQCRKMCRRRELPFKLWWAAMVLALFFITASCAPQKRVNVPVYRVEPQEQTPKSAGQTATLLASADKAIQAGKLDKAEMHLERALRLSPRDAQLWQAMARVRFEQGNYGQAVQFCLKSNSLAGTNATIVRQNWLLMEKAYLKTGEKEKAAQARQKANERY